MRAYKVSGSWSVLSACGYGLFDNLYKFSEAVEVVEVSDMCGGVGEFDE